MKKNQLPRVTEAALRERVKELTCLYGIAQIAAQPGISVEAILGGIVALLPPAWQYPEIAVARIVLDDREYKTPGFVDSPRKQTAEIRVGGVCRGRVEIVYVEERPDFNGDPFLKEEKDLIEGVAKQVSLIVLRREAEEERANLQHQLRHADRLATVGLLAAGVAHELNEPLGNVLGFAQLARKCPGLPEQAKGDVEKIEEASLHAREIIKNLLVFARRMPPQKALVNLNRVVKEALCFLASRCDKDGILLVQSLDPDLPEVTADPGQISQVLVNLCVNALQAMPNGGRLTVRTEDREDHVSIVVEDTGVGMGKEVIDKVFIPFFTTKDVGEGTGLGLPVVHGIVTSHGGSVKVSSEVGRGSTFEIRLPRGSRQIPGEDR